MTQKPSGQFSLLATKRFLPMFVTQALGAFNDNLFRFVILGLVTYSGLSIEGAQSELIVPLAGGLFILPFFLFSATGGQLADRYPKSSVVRFVKAAEILIMAVACLGFMLQNLSLLLTVLLFMGAQSAFFGPVKYGILPDLLKPGELVGGNALIEAGTFVAILAGTILGGWLSDSANQSGVQWASVLIVVIAIFGYLASRTIPASPARAPDLKVNPNIFSATWRMVQLITVDKAIFRAICGISWFWLLGTVFQTLLPIFAKDSISSEIEVWLLLLTLFSVGVAIGSLLCNKLTNGRVTDILVPFGAIGLTIFGVDIWFATRDWVASAGGELYSFSEFLQVDGAIRIMVDFFMVAISAGIYIVPLYTIVQHRANEAERARQIAGNNILNAFAMVIASLLLIVLLASGLSAPVILLITSVLNIPVAIYIAHIVIGKGARKAINHLKAMR